MNKDIITAAIMFILIIGFCLFIWRLSRYNKNLPHITAQAIVVRKKVDKWKNGVNSPLIKEYYVEFGISGERIDLKVPKKKDYERLEEGVEGTLSYQKNKLFKIFVDFK